MITIVPAIDIFEGKCVRLTQGMYTQKKIYNENPLEVAKLFEDNGFKRLHLVDLEGAKNSKVVNHRVLQSIASKTNLIIDFGGGFKSIARAVILFEQMLGVFEIRLESEIGFNFARNVRMRFNAA